MKMKQMYSKKQTGAQPATPSAPPLQRGYPTIRPRTWGSSSLPQQPTNADGLRACGRDELAADVGRRFLATVRDGGFAENFEATTGRPLRDRGYSWSAAVLLLLASELEAARPEEGPA